MANRIQGPKIVFALVLVILGILAWAFYRYYTVQPDPERLRELQEQRAHEAETPAPAEPSPAP